MTRIRQFNHTERSRGIVEAVLGRKLKGGELVHHANGDETDDSNHNLVVCPDHEYHRHLHRRLQAFWACGDPNKVKCQYCKQWDNAVNMRSVQKNDRPSTTYWHAVCRQKHRSHK